MGKFLPRVILINDSKVELTMLSSSLRKRGIEVKTFNDPFTGLEMIKKEYCYCIIVDNVMPNMSGIELTNKVRELDYLKLVPIILMTSQTETKSLCEALQHGIDDYIFKGSPETLFVEKVKSMIRKAEIQFNNLQLIKEREDFLSVISHDLKGPIAFIESSMKLIKDNFSHQIPEEALEFIKKSEDRAHFTLDLVKEILELGRTEKFKQLHLTKFNIKDILNDCIDTFHLKAKEKNISLNIKADDIYYLTADKSKFLQVINNLIGNAVKFLPIDGKVDISAAPYNSNESLTTSCSNILKIEISDNGPGIPKDSLELIFDKYNRGKLKDTESGTGLGLAICRQICKLHGGTIWCENVVTGSGAKFCLLIPGLSIQNHRVLICDYLKERRELLRIELEKNDIIVIESDSGQDAINYLSSKKSKDNPPKLIVIDVEKDGLDGSKSGLNTAKEIKHIPEMSSTPLIFQTSIQDKEDLKELSFFGDDIISKPFQAHEINYKIVKRLKRDKSLNNTSFLFLGDWKKDVDVINNFCNSKKITPFFAKNSIEAYFISKQKYMDMIVLNLNKLDMDLIEFTLSESKSENCKEIVVFTNETLVDKTLLHSFSLKHTLSHPISPIQLNRLYSIFTENSVKEKKIVNNVTPKIEFKDEIRDEVRDEGKRDSSSLKILIADDSDDNIFLFKTFIKDHRCELICVNNGEKAIEEFQRQNFDLVLLDIQMPLKNGHETVKELRKLEKDNSKIPTKIFAITSYDSPEEVQKCYHSGFDKHLARPIHKEIILQIIQFQIDAPKKLPQE